MATYKEATIQQSTGEIRQWVFDYTNDLPSAVTVSSGTAIHTPPSGAAATLTISAASPYLNVKLGPLTVTGVHYLDAKATLSNAEVSEMRLTFTVNYPTMTARVGMVPLITEVRLMADAGANDFSIAGVPHWSDAQIQTQMDKHRTEVIRSLMTPVETYASGTVVFRQYYSEYGNLEETTAGTSIFYLENAAGSQIGSSAWTMDYTAGKATFGSDTGGSTVYMYGYSYDLNGAAADIWRMKAAKAAAMFDFSTDNMSVKRSQYREGCLEMANYFAGQAAPSVMQVYREDTNL